MIIGIDASRANRRHKTGTEWYSYYLIRWLAKLDRENQYILYTDKPLTGGLLDLSTEQYRPGDYLPQLQYDAKGFQKIKSPGNNFKAKVLRWPFSYFWTQGRMSLEMMKRPVDVLFIPAHVLPVIHPRRSVVTVHDIGYEEQLAAYNRDSMGMSRQKQPKILNFIAWLFTRGKYRANALDYLRWSTEHSIKGSDRAIAISEFTKRTINKFYGRQDKVTVVHNGYNKFLYKKIGDQGRIAEVLGKYGIEQPYLFYVGRIERKKNIPALIEAFAIIKEKNRGIKEKLVMVGDASYGYDEVKYLIREFDLVDDVVMPGWVEEEDIPYFYNGATAFIFPSRYEGFGIPLLQAMACGVPIAASETTSIPEVVGEAALLFNPDYSFSMAEAMEKIIKDRDLRQNLVAKGRERVKDFSWKKTAEETLRVITYQD